MAQAPRDQNRVPTLLGTSSTDGTTPVPVYADATTNRLLVDIKESAASDSITGGPVTVGTSAVEMTFTGTTTSICIKAASTNTGIIYVGPATVDNTGANAYAELTADSAVTFDLDDASAALYAAASAAAQKVFKAALV